MRDDEFFAWMIENGYNNAAARTRLANCRKICRYEDDLDTLFEEDCLEDLMERLQYSTADLRRNSEPRHHIPINGNIYTGTATLRTAAALYLDFANNNNRTVGTRTANTTPQRNWPIWEQPSEDEIYKLAKVTTKYVKFLSPEIIGLITEDNVEHQEEWRQKLQNHNINSDLYLWENSPCGFPGIRRAAGSTEIAALRGRVHINDYENALRVDDNDFPKHIWSFVFCGRKFQKHGPTGYSLAHLIDHKKDGNRMENEFTFEADHQFNQDAPFYGLYSSPANAVYIPNSLMKPTDFSTCLRNLLFQKAFALYSDYCNLVPPYVTLNAPTSNRWHFENFEWSAPVGNTDDIRKFLEYRNQILERL